MWNNIQLPLNEKLELFPTDLSVKIENDMDDDLNHFSFTSQFVATRYDEGVGIEEYLVAYARGSMITDLDEYECAFDAGSSRLQFDYEAFSVFFEGSILEEVSFDYELYDSLIEEDDSFEFCSRVLYFEKVNVHPQIAAVNLGALLVHSTVSFMMRLLQKKFPTLALLGAYPEIEGKGPTVCRYFERYGFKEVEIEQDGPKIHCLSPSKVKPLKKSTFLFIRKTPDYRLESN